MALSNEARIRLVEAVTNQALGTEIADAIDVNDSRFRISKTLTVAESNAGKTLLASTSVLMGKKVYIDNVQIAVGGATAWSATASSTKLVIQDLNGTPVPLCDATLAGMTGNNLLLLSDPTHLILKAAAVTGGANAGYGITVRSDGTHDMVAGSTLTIVITGRIL